MQFMVILQLNIFLERADHQKQNMGLMTWQDAPDGKIKRVMS